MSFDHLAPVYRLMERIAAGEKMQRCRTAFLDRIPPAQNILTLGEGHGRFLGQCIRRFPRSPDHLCGRQRGDAVTGAKNLATQKLDIERVHWLQADILDWTPPAATFDLIATHFFLDCFRADQLTEVVPKIASAATNDASWLLADFQQAAHGWRRVRSRIILAIMYAFFRAVARLPAKSLTPPDPFLRETGFQLQERIETEWSLLHSDWWRRAP